MRKCPYCAEEIQCEAIKCKHCGEWLSATEKPKNNITNGFQIKLQKNTTDTVIHTKTNEPTKFKGRKICEDCGMEFSEAESSINPFICITCAEKNTRNSELHIVDSSKHWGTSDAEISSKEPRKYGWGWVLFYGMLASYTFRNHFNDAALSVLGNALPIIFLIPYFWLRRKFIAKWEYDRWKPGLVAGICTSIVTIIIFVLMAYFDSKSMR